MMKIFLWTVLLFGCAIAASFRPKIVGGEGASPHEFPYMISLQWMDNPNQTHFCGGSLLSEKWVITAAHCILAFSDDTEIVAGAHLIDTPDQYEQRRKPKRVIMHEDYDVDKRPGPNDLALIEVDPFVFNDKVNSLSLPPSDAPYPSGILTFSGWGSTSRNEVMDLPNNLLKAPLDIVTLELCFRIYGGYNSPLADTNICAGDRHRAPCNCDSGGPLVEKDASGKVILRGTTSWSYQPCGVPGMTAVFANVAHYVSWIEENMKSK